MCSPRTSTGLTRTGIVLVAAGAFASASCGRPPSDAPRARDAKKPTIVLISIDGFAARYLDSSVAPTIHRLAREGVHAPQGMVPVFPSKTFPNHYSIVTGLYAEHHGIVANTMYDPEWDASFSLSDRAAVSDSRWWGGEPVWVTAEKQGLATAAFFWPGSEASIKGVRPRYWKPYDESLPSPARVDSVLAWLALPDSVRPHFVTLYFSEVDDAGHDFGPGSPQLRSALARVDSMVRRLVSGLGRGAVRSVNVVIVADHGMAEVSADRVIYLNDYVPMSWVRMVDWSPVAAIIPNPGRDSATYVRLRGAHPHLRVYRKAETPEAWHYRDHRRIAPIIAVADEGWSIEQRRVVNVKYGAGNHGFDPTMALSMRALFVANGPSFARGVRVPPFTNVHLYELFCAVLGLKPAPNDGSLDTLRAALAQLR